MVRIAIVAAIAWPAAAQLDSMEKACGLKFDQKAIEVWIERNVKASDMEFAGSINLMTMGTMQDIKDMSAAQKAALCTQIRRIAKANKFIAD
ncbi:MAG: hypothetical protein AB7O38_17765 [Pirellulaceae bacterium]